MAATLVVSNIRPPDTGGRTMGGVGGNTLEDGANEVQMQKGGGGPHSLYAQIVSESNPEDGSGGARLEGWRLQQRGGRSVLLGWTAEEQEALSRAECYNCGESGHLARDCGKPRQPKCCFTCKGDHLQISCPIRRERNLGQQTHGSSSREPGGRREQHEP